MKGLLRKCLLSSRGCVLLQQNISESTGKDSATSYEAEEGLRRDANKMTKLTSEIAGCLSS